MNNLILSAVNNGFVDATETLRAAINSFPSIGGQLFIPAGTYIISGSLYYPSYISFVGENAKTTRIFMNGTASIFEPKNKASAQTSHVRFNNLYLDRSTIYSGGYGIDGTGLQNTQIEKVWINNQDYAIYIAGGIVGGGGYNDIRSCEISNCNYGVYFYNGAQANRIVGGRIHDNFYSAVYGNVCGGNFVQTSIDSQNNRPAIVITNGDGWGISSTYFQNNALGAIEFSTGSTRNTEIGNYYYSGPGGSVTDIAGFSLSLSPTAYGNSLSGLGTGWNLITGSFDNDTDADGIADGWAVPPSPALGMTLSLDSSITKHLSGSSQKWNVSAAGSTNRNLICSASVQPGENYVFSGWVYTDTPNKWRVRIGISVAASDYLNLTIPKINEWIYIKQAFQTTTEACVISINNSNFGASGADQNIWLDSFKLERGSIPKSFDVGVAQGI